MSKQLKKTIELEIDGQEVTLDVTWKIIEIVERTCGSVADIVASEILVNNPMRHQVAEIVSEWVRSGTMRKKDVKEYVMTCGADDFMRYVGSIQGAVLYSLKYIDTSQLEALTQGHDLPTETSDDEEEGEDHPT